MAAAQCVQHHAAVRHLLAAMTAAVHAHGALAGTDLAGLRALCRATARRAATVLPFARQIPVADPVPHQGTHGLLADPAWII